jgi:hypothetical protein
VRLEKVMVLLLVVSGLKLPMNWLMQHVLAVPGEPTNREAFSTE